MQNHEVSIELTTKDDVTFGQTPICVNPRRSTVDRVPLEVLLIQSPPMKRRITEQAELERVPVGLFKFMATDDLTATALRMNEKSH